MTVCGSVMPVGAFQGKAPADEGLILAKETRKAEQARSK
jgi:hypothetical protein